MGGVAGWPEQPEQRPLTWRTTARRCARGIAPACPTIAGHNNVLLVVQAHLRPLTNSPCSWEASLPIAARGKVDCMVCAVRSHSGGLLCVARVQRRGHDRLQAAPQHTRPVFLSGATLVATHGPGCCYKGVHASTCIVYDLRSDSGPKSCASLYRISTHFGHVQIMHDL